jgi:hypothetical protein
MRGAPQVSILAILYKNLNFRGASCPPSVLPASLPRARECSHGTALRRSAAQHNAATRFVRGGPQVSISGWWFPQTKSRGVQPLAQPAARLAASHALASARLT